MTYNDRRTKKEKLFEDIHTKLAKLDPSVGESIYCPLCWKKFTVESTNSQLSTEHVPPASSAQLIGEKCLVTLTCKKCNNKFGTEYQNDLKIFLIHQLWQSDKYYGTIPGKITLPNSSPVRCDIIWNSKEIKIIGIPKANNPAIIKEHMSILNEIIASKTEDWNFKLDGNLGYKRSNVWNAYFHSAYLVAYIRTGGMYSFSPAGLTLRKCIMDKQCSEFGICIIPSQVIGVAGTPWIAIVDQPDNLRCLWVKLAANIVILPRPENPELSKLYKAWQQACNTSDFGLLPRDEVHFKISFFTKADFNEAQKCLPTFFSASATTK
jgi:hypothetical protein